MSKCDLKITLFDRPKSYQLGDTVRGEVAIDVNKDCECNGIDVVLLHRAHGRGNRAETKTPAVKLFQGRLIAGDRKRLEFELPLDAGPVTYHGKYLNVDWYVRAQADIPWAIDPKAEEDIVVALGDDPDRVELPPEKPLTKSLGAPRSIGCVPILSLLIVMLSPAAFILWLSTTNPAYRSLVKFAPIALFGGIGALVLFVVIYRLVASFLAERKLGSVEVEVSPVRCQSGGPVTVTIKFRPPSGVSLNSATATLTGEEIVVSGSGTNRTTHTNKFHDQTVTLCGAKSLPPGRQVVLEGTIEIPPDAPYSFQAPSNTLDWGVTLLLDIAHCPDWAGKQPLVVGP